MQDECMQERRGEPEEKKKEGGLRLRQKHTHTHTHTHTHPLLSLQSGLGVQEAACASMCCRERVCVYRVQRAL